MDDETYDYDARCMECDGKYWSHAPWCTRGIPSSLPIEVRWAIARDLTAAQEGR